MDIESKGFIINVTQKELRTICSCIEIAIIHNARTHWINHQSSWENGEKEPLYILKQAFSNLGRIDLYEDIFKKVEDIFKKFNFSRLK